MKFEGCLNDVNNNAITEETKSKNTTENEYDQEASDNEMESFQKEIKEKVRVKVEELGISKEELIGVTGLDLESLKVKKPKEGELKEPNLRRGELDFIRSDIDAVINEFNKENIDEAISEFKRNKKEGEELGDENLQDKNPLGASKYEKFAEFVSKHKKVVTLGQLALYLSSSGMPVLNALADNDAKVEIEGEEIYLKYLVDNPELIEKIDQASNAGTPIDILREYPTERNFDYGDDGIEKSFSIFTETEIGDNNEIKKTASISFLGAVPTTEEMSRLNSELHDIGVSLGTSEHKYEEGKGFVLTETEGGSWKDFIENKEQVAKIIADTLNISEDAVEKYIDNLIMPDVSKISVVELDNFEINKDLDIPEDVFKLNDKWDEICEKHQGINSDAGYWLDASEKEFTEWVKENGYENVENSSDARKLLIEEKEDYKNSSVVKFEGLRSQEKESVEYKNIDKFKDLFLEGLNESGYSVEELKKIAEDDPEKVIGIISEVIGENVSYDLKEWFDIVFWDEMEKAKEIFGVEHEIKKHSEGIPYVTMESEKGVCHDYAITFMAAKHILEEEGVSNLDKFVVVSTASNGMNHQWNNLVTIDPDGKLIVSSLDPTWADSSKGELNAVDEKHYYTSLPEELSEAHQEALEKIKDWNNLVKQKNLERILTEYDPRQYDRDHRIEGNKELRETDEYIDALREKKTKSVKDSLKEIRERISKL